MRFRNWTSSWPGATSFRQRGLGIGAGGDQAGADLFAARENDSRRDVFLDQDAFDRCLEADDGAGLLGRLGQHVAQGAHAAGGQMEAAHALGPKEESR